MGTAIGELLPLAVAIAISATTIITTVLMLLSPKAKSRTVGLLWGVVGVGGCCTFTLLADLLPTQFRRVVTAGVCDQDGGRCASCGVGAERVARAAYSGDRAGVAEVDGGVDSMMPGKALVLGLLLSAVVPKNLLLALSAGLIVGEAGFGSGRAAVVIVVFTAIAIDRGGTGCRPSRGADANARAIREATGVAG
jgi:hypothetical protein